MEKGTNPATTKKAARTSLSLLATGLLAATALLGVSATAFETPGPDAAETRAAPSSAASPATCDGVLADVSLAWYAVYVQPGLAEDLNFVQEGLREIETACAGDPDLRRTVDGYPVVPLPPDKQGLLADMARFDSGRGTCGAGTEWCMVTLLCDKVVICPLGAETPQEWCLLSRLLGPAATPSPTRPPSEVVQLESPGFGDSVVVSLWLPTVATGERVPLVVDAGTHDGVDVDTLYGAALGLDHAVATVAINGEGRHASCAADLDEGTAAALRTAFAWFARHPSLDGTSYFGQLMPGGPEGPERSGPCTMAIRVDAARISMECVGSCPGGGKCQEMWGLVGPGFEVMYCQCGGAPAFVTPEAF